MYLKKIEVQGFKSFAGRLVFDFDSGITGIVGPNGSGKSNIADAVRWVLGEQSARQLRGGNMQDVIFSGTQARRPLSFARVALTLDNADRYVSCDFDEITVERKLYRSGESEYLLNGSECRLKDINELFYDTGIGKEGYSIIGQGQVEQILSGRPEEKRELFDEAAGIVKYKKRKAESVKKLEDERRNLLRVTDILAELEKQVGPLKAQSEKAREYLKRKEELKALDANLFLLETERIKKESRVLDEKYKTASDELKLMSSRYESTKTEYGKIEEQSDAIEAKLDDAKNKASETKVLRQHLKGQISLLEEQLRAAAVSDERYSERFGDIKSGIEMRRAQLKDLDAEKSDLTRALEKKKTEDEKTNEELRGIRQRILKVREKADAVRSELVRISNDRSFKEGQLQKFEAIKGQLKERSEAVKERLTRLSGEERDARGESARLNELRRDIISEKDARTANIRSCEEKISVLSAEIDEKTKESRLALSEFNREESRLESLKNMAERYDGYGGSIRRVMEKRAQESGILGVVADLIKAPKKYETAVETALGPAIQNIVTEDEKTAKKMISFLKTNRFGRATFLPLSNLKANVSRAVSEAAGENGAIGVASSLVRTDEKYEILSRHLLGRTLVATDIDAAAAIAKKYGQSIRIVTLDGELISPGGAMTGGAFKNSGNLIGRKREIDELTGKVRILKEKSDAALSDSERLREERSALFSRLDDEKAGLADADVRLNTADIGIAQADAKATDAAKETKRLKAEDEELKSRVKALAEESDDVVKRAGEGRVREDELKTDLTGYEDELKKLSEEEGRVLKENEESLISDAKIKQRHDFIAENEERVKAEIAKLKEEEEALLSAKEDLGGDRQRKEEEISGLHKAVADSDEVSSELESAITDFSRQKEELSRKHRDFLEDRERLARDMAGLDKEIFRLNAKKEGYEQAARRQTDYLWEEYELTYDGALKMKDAGMTDINDLRKRIFGLKNVIKQLGNVNVNAIDEYKDVSGRYEFMKLQHADLIEAEGKLIKIIDDLDEEMRARFKERFAEINAEFDKVFKHLFGGGKGELILTDEGGDVLEAGIKIIAQPPGKKLQNMMQLSGGEKSLAAIALLFAIQNLKPSPFCLLDEIEAALDDTNVERFAAYLNALTKHTQFIVITHRKGTMAAADRLYGITMQEKGVSSVVSVDLIEKDLS